MKARSKTHTKAVKQRCKWYLTVHPVQSNQKLLKTGSNPTEFIVSFLIDFSLSGVYNEVSNDWSCFQFGDINNKGNIRFYFKLFNDFYWKLAAASIPENETVNLCDKIEAFSCWETW